MRTLARNGDLQSILGRLNLLNVRDHARWGRMNPQQMLCHLGDSMLIPLGEMHVGDTSNLFRRSLWKWGAFYAPVPWPKGVPTPPEIDQCLPGRQPVDFEAGRSRVRQLLLHFAETNVNRRRHPYFGSLSQAEWMRWGWLHADHHLRQFGR
jgi:Protein of unknown function (DUF1569)